MMTIKLTPEVESKILASIRAGGFVGVAAQAWGVSRRLCRRWLNMGRKKGAREPYRSFAANVDQAQGQARLKAEAELLRDDAKCWLQHGPGKEMPGKPGWSSLAKPLVKSPRRAESLFANVPLLKLLKDVRTVLGPHPDAQLQLDQVVDARPER